MERSLSETSERIRVLVSADDPLVRAGLRVNVDAFEHATVIAETANLRQAVARVRPDYVDALVASLSPQEDPAGFGLFQASSCAVILLAEANRQGLLLTSLNYGVRCFVDKSAAPSELGQALKAAAQGHAFLSPGYTRAVLEWLVSRLSSDGPNQGALSALSSREREVLEQLGQARSNTEIAHRLRIRETTVRSHVSNVIAKLTLETRAEAVVFGYRTALLRGSP
jgi:DNA-binding NarL/FixJ family response regulator